jgi:hypothetical protein
LAQFQRVLWAWDGGDPEKDITGVTRRALKLLDIICRILELAECQYNPSSVDTMRNLDVCRKIYLRTRSSEQRDPSVPSPALRNALHFTLTAAKVSRDPADFWGLPDLSLGTGDSHSPEDFNWLVDYYLDIYSGDQEVAFEFLFLLGGMKMRCSAAKQNQFIENLIACMGTNMPVHLRYAALRAARIVREEIASIDAMDAELRDIVLTKLSPSILTTVCPRPGTTLANDSHHFFDYNRDLCYLKLIFALAKDSSWHVRLIGDHNINWCISMIAEYCESYSLHSFYLSGILFRISPEQLSVASLDGVTGRQWWNMIMKAWYYAYSLIDDTHCFEFLPVLVEGTKRYMQNALEYELQWLIGYMNAAVRRAVEKRDSEQGEDGCVVVAVKEFSNMLKKLVNSKGVISP